MGLPGCQSENGERALGEMNGGGQFLESIDMIYKAYGTNDTTWLSLQERHDRRGLRL